MNPYNSIWTGVHPGDGPREFHVILMDNARTEILADEEARQTLHCIRCGACQNACPVYRRPAATPTAASTPAPSARSSRRSLQEMHHAQSLPYASSLCGACYEVCPVKINIPEVLIHLRNKVQNTAGISGARKHEDHGSRWMPGLLGGWTQARDLHLMPKQTFRDWWEKREKDAN
jgi:L-lactate dehydrogenase complex protein LldF